MKSVSFTLALIIITAASFAQGVFSNNTNAALEKVIQDYPNRFHNIKGEMIVQKTQTTEYRSTVQIPGSYSTIVTRYNAAKSDAYSWDCIAFESPDFNQAKNKFKEIFSEIRNSIVKIEGEKPFILNGQYEAPAEDKKFTTIAFELLPAVGNMKKLKIDLSLQNDDNKWKIVLNVYDRDQKEEGQLAVTSK